MQTVLSADLAFLLMFSGATFAFAAEDVTDDVTDAVDVVAFESSDPLADLFSEESQPAPEEGTQDVDSQDVAEPLFDVSQDGFSFTFDAEAATATLTRYNGSAAAVEVPQTVERDGVSFAVVEIAARAFEGSSVSGIKVPSSVTTVGAYAFAKCTSLTSVDLPDSVTALGGGAFSDCTSLGSVKLPRGITVVKWSLFSRCSSLSSVEIPDTVELIDYEAFSRCTSLRSVSIPSSVKTIGRAAFFGSGLTMFTAPAGLTEVGDCAFSDS